MHISVSYLNHLADVCDEATCEFCTNHVTDCSCEKCTKIRVTDWYAQSANLRTVHKVDKGFDEALLEVNRRLKPPPTGIPPSCLATTNTAEENYLLLCYNRFKGLHPETQVAVAVVSGMLVAALLQMVL